jgi:hypothetical protein
MIREMSKQDQFDEEEQFVNAAKNGDLWGVQFSVEHGINIRARNDKALMLSAINGHLNVVKYLIEKGANLHALNEGALRISVQSGHFKVAAYLIEKGANLQVAIDRAEHMTPATLFWLKGFKKSNKEYSILREMAESTLGKSMRTSIRL